MKLYKVTAKEYDYDQYDSFIVWANTPEEALFLARSVVNENFYARDSFASGANVEEAIEPKYPCVLLYSFNAG